MRCLERRFSARDSRLSVATCLCHIELYLTHIQVKGKVHTLKHTHINKVIADMYV